MRNSSRPEETDEESEVPRRSCLGNEADERAEAKAAFHLRMRARGVQDLKVLRAFELVPRAFFVPHRYRALALRHLALPIGCGQTLLEPWLVARMIEALDVSGAHRVLEIGAGTGYATAILASLVRDVVGIERYRSLAVAAQARLDDLAITNAAIVWGDGLAISPTPEAFDRILVHGRLVDVPQTLTNRLVPGGVLVCARSGYDGSLSQNVVRIEKAASENATESGSSNQNGGDPSGQSLAQRGLVETVVCTGRLQAIVTGVAAVL